MPTTGTTSPTPGTAPSSAPADATADRPPAGLAVTGLVAGYGGPPAVRGVSLAVPRGEFLTLLGPSGCGKTTVLKAIGGYLTPSAGTVAVHGRDVSRLPPERRNVGMVFQSYALFPHLTARQNVAFGPEVRGLGRTEARRRADAMLDRVGLTAAERDRKPAALSGGQQQRVALARALVTEPDVLLLDEPFANLDRPLREQLRGELRRLQRETGVTTVLVTHDQEEALTVSDAVAVMAGGRVVQAAPPAELYRRPRTPAVARAVGAANLLDGKWLGGRAGSAWLVRPEWCVLGPAAGGCRWSWPGAVRAVSFRGADALVDVACDTGPSLVVRVAGGDVRVGDRVVVGVPADAGWCVPDGDGGGP